MNMNLKNTLRRTIPGFVTQHFDPTAKQFVAQTFTTTESEMDLTDASGMPISKESFEGQDMAIQLIQPRIKNLSQKTKTTKAEVAPVQAS
jgi:hypothetical protein